jgi:hypothetical protein
LALIKTSLGEKSILDKDSKIPYRIQANISVNVKDKDKLLDLNDENVVLIVEKIKIFLNKVVLQVVAYTNTTLEDEYEYLEEYFDSLDDIEDGFTYSLQCACPEEKDHIYSAELTITEIVKIMADPAFFVSLLNNKTIITSGEAALMRYDVLPRLRLLEKSKPGNKAKVKRYMA